MAHRCLPGTRAACGVTGAQVGRVCEGTAWGSGRGHTHKGGRPRKRPGGFSTGRAGIQRIRRTRSRCTCLPTPTRRSCTTIRRTPSPRLRAPTSRAQGRRVALCQAGCQDGPRQGCNISRARFCFQSRRSRQRVLVNLITRIPNAIMPCFHDNSAIDII